MTRFGAAVAGFGLCLALAAAVPGAARAEPNEMQDHGQGDTPWWWQGPGYDQRGYPGRYAPYRYAPDRYAPYPGQRDDRRPGARMPPRYNGPSPYYYREDPPRSGGSER